MRYWWVALAALVVAIALLGDRLRRKAAKGKGPKDIYPFW